MSRNLEVEIEIPIRFSEVDSLRIVWHGNYIKYFEDAREAFGKKYQFGYLDVFEAGFVTPLVHIHCDYKKPLKYGDTVIAKAIFQNTEAAKIIFKYELYNYNTKELVATGETIQVFLTVQSQELYIITPEFMCNWKKKWIK